MLILSVKSSLLIDAALLSMSDINDEYISILKEYGINGMYSSNHKKYLSLNQGPYSMCSVYKTCAKKMRVK